MTAARARRGRAAQQRGVFAEDAAAEALAADGWTVLARRYRTAAGEIDLLAESKGVLAVVEVKQRPTLLEAAYALGARQRARLLAAAEVVLGEHPEWGRDGVRFDVLLVDGTGQVRRIADAFRSDN